MTLPMDSNNIDLGVISDRVVVRNVNGTTDYNELENHPTLDGREIVGDIPELDPTVPEWAKQKEKPKYSIDEIEGGEELSENDIQALWDEVFNK